MSDDKDYADMEEVIEFFSKNLGFGKRAYRIGNEGVGKKALVLCYWGFVKANDYGEPKILVFKALNCKGTDGNNLSQCADYQDSGDHLGVLKYLERKGLKPIQESDFITHKGVFNGKIPSWAIDMVNSYEVAYRGE